MEEVWTLVMTYSPKIVYALITLIIGLWVVRMITNAVSKVMVKRNIDASLAPFLMSLINTLLKIMVIITVMTMLGIQMTSFIAILGAAGFAIGMALSGTLQNFAGGVMILIFKPFKVDDFVEAQGFTGIIKEIQIFNTIMRTVDNKTIIIPNGGLSTGAMINYSTEATRRVDMTFGIGYDDDIKKTKEVLTSIMAADKRVLKDPAVFIAVSELADSSVNFAVRAWVNSADYWGVFFDTQETVKITFDKEGISIPFPQRDIHLFNQKSND